MCPLICTLGLLTNVLPSNIKYNQFYVVELESIDQWLNSLFFNVIWLVFTSSLFLFHILIFTAETTKLEFIPQLPWEVPCQIYIYQPCPLFKLLELEETKVPRENHQLVASHWQHLSHNVVSSTPHIQQGLNSQLYWW